MALGIAIANADSAHAGRSSRPSMLDLEPFTGFQQTAYRQRTVDVTSGRRRFGRSFARFPEAKWRASPLLVFHICPLE